MHFLPTLICIILAIVDVPLWHTNYIIFTCQMVVYFYLIFRYLRLIKNLVREHLSDIEWLQILWIPRFMAIMLVLLTLALICHFINSDVDRWLYQILNVVAMSYLVYEELQMVHRRLTHIDKMQQVAVENMQEVLASPVELQSDKRSDISDAEREELEGYARAVCQWLEQSEAYINPDFSLHDLAKAVNISSKKLSKSINQILDKSFFDLVNSYRIEKSKQLLIEKKELGLTLETIAEQCGFNTHYTYCRAFKKYTGLTTQQWLNSTNLPNH